MATPKGRVDLAGGYSGDFVVFYLLYHNAHELLDVDLLTACAVCNNTLPLAF